MSYTICYDRRIFKVGEDKYIAMLLCGDNNVYTFSGNREVASKNWYAFRHKGEFVLSKETLELELDYQGDTDCLARSRHNFFSKDEKEFKKWILSGLRNAITVEEAVSYNRRNRFIIERNDDSNVFSYAETTEDLLGRINSFKSEGHPFDLSLDCKEFKPKRRNITPRQKKRYEKFFAIEIAKRGDFEKNTIYLCSLSRNAYKYYYTPEPSIIKKFKTEKEAQRYADKHRARFMRSNNHIRVAEINKPAML